MGLWSEIEEYDDLEDYEENQYLTNPEKGIELVSKLLSYDNKNTYKNKNIKKLDYLLDRKLLEVLGKINISNEIELYEKLINLSDKIYEQNKMKLLKNKSVIGIGGKFSAGKSKFINAILECDVVTEDQNPTTSIATYIVHGKNEDIRAYTYNDQNISLDMEAAQALTHAFYNAYGIGFSKVINNLVMNITEFKYKNLAVLDTPGYNKSNSSIKKNVTDSEKAYRQLRTVDFLIWLIDIENGVVQQPDIEFIKSLKPKNPILVVLNKADKKTYSAIDAVLESTRESLKNSDIKVYDVIAYSALNIEEYGGKNRLASFMGEAERQTNRNEDIERKIREIINTIYRQLNLEKNNIIKRRNEIGNIIFRSEDILEIKSLVQLYHENIEKLNDVDYALNSFKKTEKSISNLLTSISRR